MPRDTTPTEIVLSGQPAANGQVAAVYRCRQQLDKLVATDHPEIKFCGGCQQRVFKVIDFDGFDRAIASKGCVWGPVDLRSSADKAPVPMFLGSPVPAWAKSSLLRWDD